MSINERARLSNKRGHELTGELKYPRWQKVPANTMKEKGYYPNHLWYNSDGEVAIELKRTNGPDWSLNSKCVADAIAAERSGRVVQAYVRLLDYDGSYVAHDTVQNVVRKIGSATPQHGSHGPYWWIDQNFEPAPSSGFCPI